MPPRDVLLICPAGFESLVRQAAPEDLPDLVIDEMSSGYIRGSTAATPEVLSHLPCATNVFELISTAPRSETGHELGRLTSGLRPDSRPPGMPRHGGFRLRIFDDGRFATTSVPGAADATRALQRWSGLRHESRGGGCEFWVVRRRGAQTVLGLRLQRPRAEPPRGSLRPEVAAALVRAVPRELRRRLLDPFAGSGSIGLAALNAGAEHVWVNDRSSQALGLLAGVRKAAEQRITRTHLDFRELPAVVTTEVTAVVTDPPWGHYEESDEPIESLYSELASVVASILKPGRHLVLLTGAPSVDHIVAAAGTLTVLGNQPVLINGRKARVIQAERR